MIVNSKNHICLKKYNFDFKLIHNIQVTAMLMYYCIPSNNFKQTKKIK